MILYKITTKKQHAYYQKKLRRLERWLDRYQKPFWLYSSYPVNDRLVNEWWLITQSLTSRNSIG